MIDVKRMPDVSGVAVREISFLFWGPAEEEISMIRPHHINNQNKNENYLQNTASGH